MLSPFTIFFFILVTIIFLSIAMACIIYFGMAIRQLNIGYKESNSARKKSGWLTVIITLGLLVTIVIYYLRLL